MSVLPNDYDRDPGRFLVTEQRPHDDAHPVVAAAYLRIHGFSEAAATDSAATLRLPLTLTMRGCVAYAAKASAAP